VARVFAAYEHCPECGAELQRAAQGAPSNLACPRCTDALRAKLVGDVLIDECERCFGLWLDHVAIRRVIEDRQQARAEALLGALPRAEVHAQKPGERMYIKCPCCQVLMNRRLFATGVIVDVCRAHGTFFDAGELPAIVDFVMKGGLEQAEKRDLERERQRLEREKALLRGGPIMIEPTTSSSTSTAFIDLLMTLVK
jgi:Zn-finger nucleic acid-binding protein